MRVCLYYRIFQRQQLKNSPAPSKILAFTFPCAEFFHRFYEEARVSIKTLCKSPNLSQLNRFKCSVDAITVSLVCWHMLWWSGTCLDHSATSLRRPSVQFHSPYTHSDDAICARADRIVRCLSDRVPFQSHFIFFDDAMRVCDHCWNLSLHSRLLSPYISSDNPTGEKEHDQCILSYDSNPGKGVEPNLFPDANRHSFRRGSFDSLLLFHTDLRRQHAQFG